MVATYQNLDRTLYQDELRMDFQRQKTHLLKLVNSNATRQGKTYQWDVQGLSGTTKTRGRDGNIVRGQLPYSKVTADIGEEFSDKFTINDIDAFTTNPAVRDSMSKAAVSVCNRGIDQKIIDILDATSTEYNASGSGITMSTLANCMKVRDALFANDVPADDGQVWFLLSLAASSQLMRIPEFKSRDFIEIRPRMETLPAIGYYRWLDVNWMMFNGLTGRTTADAKCYAFHQSAIGHVIDGEPDLHAYYFEPEHRWEYYAAIRHAGTCVLPRGVIRFYHDDTAAYA